MWSVSAGRCSRTVYRTSCFQQTFCVSNMCFLFSEGMDKVQQPESLRSPLKKTKLVKIKKKKRVRFLLPQQADKKSKPSYPGDADQKVFKCECPYCQACVGTMSGVSVGTWTEATSHSPSSEKLIQDLHNLTLNPGSTQPPVLPEGI